MFRSAASRSILKGIQTAPASRAVFTATSAQWRNTSIRQLSNKRPQVLAAIRPTRTSFYATSSEPPFDRLNEKHEHKIGQQALKPDPSHVSTESSVRPILEARSKKAEDEMMGGVKADLQTIKETFSLADVPRESLYIGAAGVLPYAATSLSTVYLAWDINHAHSVGSQGLLLSPEAATHLLEMITPLQIGWGAVIISFLGAIHWGCEIAGLGGHHSYRRYMYGVIAPAVAWPTIFMPVEYALITQFLAFNFMYFADARATARGWFPPWYATYRFVLTFFVGASIVATLVGRGQIESAEHASLRNPMDHLEADRDAQWEALEKEEKARRQALAKDEEEDEDEDAEEDEKNDKGDEEEED